MAPPPEYDKEPKAPDKSPNSYASEDSNVLNNQLNDHPGNSDGKIASSAASSDVENNKHVETLDEKKLKALLDEAITYKCPKDREGKSSLFKELLEEAEQDEACEADARAGLGGGRAGRRGGRGRRALPHSNSLQDLVAALAAEPAPRRQRHHPPVSARAIHGGSLPSGVDTSFLLGEEPRGKEYVATVRCVNPSPLNERRVSASDAAASDNELLNRRSKAMFPMTYTARATLEIGSSRAHTTTTASNHQVDSTIPFNCITSPEVVTSCTTTPSTSQCAVAVDPKGTASTVAAAAASAPASASAAATPRVAPSAVSADEYKKSLDENGNAVQGFGSPLSGSSQQKKPRRKKSSKNETVIKSHQIDGYQGNKDLNEVLRFIESNAESGRAKPPRAKHRDDDDNAKGKKRPPEQRKDKRASSLDAPLARARARTPPAAAERRSWGSARQAYCLTEPDSPPPTAPELADFQTVTKKRRARRRPSPPPSAPEPRSDSNDDLDSVRSLPLPAPPAPPPPALASYADIARTRHNIPDLIESCNYYADPTTPSLPASDDYPALEARRRARHKAGGGAAAGAGAARRKEPPAPDVVGERRPAVVLRDGAARRGQELDGVTFGFDVNEQLLCGAGGCDLLLPARGVLRYVAPPPLPARGQLVDFVANAWDDVVRCGPGKVHYFGE